jgi:hypothetical protein
LGLEVSRLARNNADWYRLLDLCGVTHTLTRSEPFSRLTRGLQSATSAAFF